MAFCKNCGSQLAENSRFCEKCGARVDTPVVNTVPAPVTTSTDDTPRMLSSNGLVYDYKRGKELSHHYTSQVRSKVYKRTIIAGDILMAISILCILVCKRDISDLEDSDYFINHKEVLRAIEDNETLLKFFWFSLIFFIIVSSIFSVAKQMHDNNNHLCVCENGIYGTASIFLVTKKFDLPYTVIERVSCQSKEGKFGHETLIIHTRGSSVSCSISHVYGVTDEINKMLKAKKR